MSIEKKIADEAEQNNQNIVVDESTLDIRDELRVPDREVPATD